MYLHDQHHSGYNSSETALQPPFSLAWSFDPDGQNNYIIGSPTVVGNVVYVGAYIDGKGAVYALAADTGEIIWQTPIDDPPAYSAPAMVNGILYICASPTYYPNYSGHLYALDANTGQVLWHKVFSHTMWCAPVVDGSLVYVITSDYYEQRLYAFDALTGEEVWSYTPPSHTSGNGNPLVINSKVVYYTGRQIVAVDAETGALAWETSFFNTNARLASWYWDLASSEENGLIYATLYGSGAPFYFCAIHADTGTVAWSHDLGGWAATCATPVIAEGKVYVSSWSQDGEDLWIFDAVTGVPEGRYPLPSVPGDYTFMTMANGVLYATTSLYWHPVIYALDATDGSLLWSAPVEDASVWPAVPANGRLYVNSETYGLIVYGPEEPPAALSISPLSQGDDWDNFLGYTYDATLVGTGNPWRADGNVVTTTLTISNTGAITATNVAITLTVPISIAVTPEVSATQHLGDLGPGQATTVTWSITATTDSPPSDFTWPAVITAAADNASPVSAGSEIQVRKTWDSGFRPDPDGYQWPNFGDEEDWWPEDDSRHLITFLATFHKSDPTSLHLAWYGNLAEPYAARPNFWIYRNRLEHGLCSGFSLSSGALYAGYENLDDWDVVVPGVVDPDDPGFDAQVPYQLTKVEVRDIAGL